MGTKDQIDQGKPGCTGRAGGKSRDDQRRTGGRGQYKSWTVSWRSANEISSREIRELDEGAKDQKAKCPQLFLASLKKFIRSVAVGVEKKYVDTLRACRAALSAPGKPEE